MPTSSLDVLGGVMRGTMRSIPHTLGGWTMRACKNEIKQDKTNAKKRGTNLGWVAVDDALVLGSLWS